MAGGPCIVMHLFKTSLENRAPAFCNCVFPKNNDIGNKQIIKTCDCGENTSNVMDWLWDEEAAHPESYICGPNVVFHPVYSQGTSIIRGDTVLKRGMHHYWEIKIVSCLSGTDVMLGIGTNKVDLITHQYRFASALGLDDQSWGYSYRGLVQNAGRLKYYGKRYSQGCIIGVYLDLFRGTLEFYLNRKPQGRAYRNICLDNVYYPMACSTSYKSSIKLINSASFDDSLQFQCMKIISKHPKLLQKVKKLPGLKNLLNNLWFLQCKEQYQYGEFEKNNMLLEDEAIICGLNKKKRRIDTEEEIETETKVDSYLCDIYDNIEPIRNTRVRLDDSSDDESGMLFYPLFCDH